MTKSFQTAILLLLASPLLIGQEAPYPPPIGKRLEGGIETHVEQVDHPVDVGTLHQPPELAESIRKMQKGTLAQRIAALKEKTLRDLVPMKAGRFWMGDFGQWHSEEGLPYSFDTDNKPPFEVELDSFSIGKYKVTYAEFDVYTDATGQPRIMSGDDFDKQSHQPGNPAGVSWFQAKAYCAWLNKLTGLPVDLPTEAQWEYAARSEGKPIVFPTDNGCSDEGRNVPTEKQNGALTKPYTHAGAESALYPVGLFPPTPMGLHDLGRNGREWVADWYGPYPHGPGVVRNPQGPAQGTERVQRSDSNHSHPCMTFDRQHREPAGLASQMGGETFPPWFGNDTFRIAVPAGRSAPAR